MHADFGDGVLVLTEVYEPPSRYGPRGGDIDRNGVFWVSLASRHLASFERTQLIHCILRVLASGALRHSVACGHFQDQIVAMLPAIFVDYTHCNAMGARLEVARQSRRPDMR